MFYAKDCLIEAICRLFKIWANNSRKVEIIFSLLDNGKLDNFHYLVYANHLKQLLIAVN